MKYQKLRCNLDVSVRQFSCNLMGLFLLGNLFPRYIMAPYEFITREVNFYSFHITGRELETIRNAIKRTTKSHCVHGEDALGSASAGPDPPSKAWLMTPVAASLCSRQWMKDNGECLISCSLSWIEEKVGLLWGSWAQHLVIKSHLGKKKCSNANIKDNRIIHFNNHH